MTVFIRMYMDMHIHTCYIHATIYPSTCDIMPLSRQYKQALRREFA